jgi:GIY-YIG catalytic domain-containing protein
MTAIYGLCDVDGEIRYVGKSNEPKRRLYVHRSSHNHYRGIPVYDWIFSLSQKGQKPSMVILEEVDNSEWEAAEQRWIAELRQQGARLLNVLDGGDTGPTLRGSENGHSTLTEEEVAEIKSRLCDGEKVKVLAADFGVSISSIGRIRKNEIWQHVPWPASPPSTKTVRRMSRETAREVKQLLQANVKRSEIAAKLNVPLNAVHKIAINAAWSNVC